MEFYRLTKCLSAVSHKEANTCKQQCETDGRFQYVGCDLILIMIFQCIYKPNRKLKMLRVKGRGLGLCVGCVCLHQHSESIIKSTQYRNVQKDLVMYMTGSTAHQIMVFHVRVFNPSLYALIHSSICLKMWPSHTAVEVLLYRFHIIWQKQQKSRSMM